MNNNFFTGLFAEFLGQVVKTSLTTGDNPNIPLPTMGGEVFWNNVSSSNGWRLQQNMLTNHARILDPRGIRRAWGDIHVMRIKFSEIINSIYY